SSNGANQAPTSPPGPFPSTPAWQHHHDRESKDPPLQCAAPRSSSSTTRDYTSKGRATASSTPTTSPEKTTPPDACSGHLRNEKRHSPTPTRRTSLCHPMPPLIPGGGHDINSLNKDRWEEERRRLSFASETTPSDNRHRGIAPAAAPSDRRPT